MMNNGQFNVFRREDARRILAKAHDSLLPGGRIVLEPQKHATVKAAGTSAPSWYACGEEGSLFSDDAHLCLMEGFWDSGEQAATQRFYVVDAKTAEVGRYALTTEAYTEEQLREVLGAAGFTGIDFYPSLTGAEVEEESLAANFVIVARNDAGGRPAQ